MNGLIKKLKGIDRGDSAAAFPSRITHFQLERLFRQTRFGTTRPRQGFIEGKHYIAKCGDWSPYSSNGHVKNEYIVDNIIRGMGFLVPESRLYGLYEGREEVLVRLAEFKEDAIPLGDYCDKASAVQMDKVFRQTVAVYPLLHLLDALDSFDGGGWDNILVDAQDRLWFVDNGCSFNYRARGLPKEWDVFARRDPKERAHGFLSLREYPRLFLLRRILGGVPDRVLWRSALRFDVGRFADSIPTSGYHRKALVEYAHSMVAVAKQMSR